MSVSGNNHGGAPGHTGPRRPLLARVAGAATERIVDTVDPDIVLDHVDVDSLVARIDLDAALARIDLDAVLARVDLDAVLARVDLEAVLARLDLESLVARAGVPDLVAASTSRMAESGLDVVRRQVAGLDLLASRASDRLLRRPRRTAEAVPPRLDDGPAASRGSRITVTGQYAGVVSRSLAALLDVLLVTATYTMGVAAADYLLGTLGLSVDAPSAVWGAVAIAVWAFALVTVTTTVTGRTPGKGLLGLRVVRDDGGVVPAGRTVVRTLLWWPSTLVAGIALLPVALGGRHRAVHDVVAGTAVVRDWGDRAAELPAPLSAFLRRAADTADPVDPADTGAPSAELTRGG